jgi:transposase
LVETSVSLKRGGVMPKKGLRLGPAQEQELKEEYQIARGRKDLDRCLRIQGLLLVHRGQRETDAAETIGVGRRTLQDWIHRYRKRGVSGLVKGPYPGGKPKLSEEQKSDLSAIIAAGPEASGFDSGVWTAPMVIKLVKDRYGVSYSSSQMARILHNLRFSMQYPTKRLSKADEAAEEQWRTQELPQIKKRPKRNWA